MSEIKVGEYVRTKTGRIYKLNYYSKEEERWICVTDEDWFPVYESEIVKHSFDIIDLIEVGDYVNGYLINYIPDNEKAVYHDAWDCVDVKKFENEDIKTIVTKEQFAEREYIV